MKKLKDIWNKLKEVLAILAFISAAVSFFLKAGEEKRTREMLEKRLSAIETSVNELEDFQTTQISVNAVDKTQIELLKEIILVLPK